jgi:hypothetical protein
MKENSQLLKTISSFLIFILLIQITGCYSFKPILASDPSIYQTDRYHYTIYTKDIVYALENPAISNGILSGKYKVDLHTSYRTNAIRLYLPSDFVVTVDTLNTINIPLDSIAKFKKSEFSVVKTVFISIIVLSSLIIGLSAFDFHIDAFSNLHLPI